MQRTGITGSHHRAPSHWPVVVGYGMLIAGFLLLGINLAGLFIEPRDREFIERIGRRPFESRPVLHLTSDEVLREAEREPDEKKRAQLVLQLVSASMVHKWDENGVHRVPLHENYFLHALSYFDPLLTSAGLDRGLFKRYEYLDHRRALARGYGFCSQQSLVVAGFLRHFGQDVAVATLGGHVVTLARFSDKSEWILDPDFGVILPFSLAHAEAFPSDVTRAYKAIGVQETGALDMANIYGRDGNSVANGDGSGARPKMFVLEVASYYLIWVFPLLLLVVGTFLTWQKANKPVWMSATSLLGGFSLAVIMDLTTA